MLSTLQLSPALSRRLLLMALLLLMLPGCQRNAEPTAPIGVPEGSAPNATTVASPMPGQTDAEGTIMLSPLPTEGDAVITGRLLDAATGEPMIDSAVQLAPVYWTSQESGAREGSFILNTAQAPFSTSDAEGRFRFDSLADGDYVIIVGDITMNYMVVTEADGENRVITATASEPTDVGDINVTWQSGAP